jgi:vacuolar-type H+-ATPase subunit H
VLRVAKPEFEAQVMEKANQIVQNARKDGGKIGEEAFAELAKGQSENPATAGKRRTASRSGPAESE